MMVSEGLPATPIGRMPERIYAVGDVHGHADRLRAIHAAIAADIAKNHVQDPLIVHLGDYIDRGPDSAACLTIAASGPIDGVPVVNLIGNHERMLLDALNSARRAETWIFNGGGATLASWGIDLETPWREWADLIPTDHLRFIRGLPTSHVVGRYVFVHAGVRPGISLAMQREEDLLWIRDEFLSWRGTMLPDAPEMLIVHGHTPCPEPDVQRNRIGIDTNAGRGGKLTCAALSKDSVYFLQV